MTREEISIRRELDYKFRQTQLGQLFFEFEDASINVWKHEYNENILEKRLRENNERLNAARKALMDEFHKLTPILQKAVVDQPRHSDDF